MKKKFWKITIKYINNFEFDDSKNKEKVPKNPLFKNFSIIKYFSFKNKGSTTSKIYSLALNFIFSLFKYKHNLFDRVNKILSPFLCFLWKADIILP